MSGVRPQDVAPTGPHVRAAAIADMSGVRPQGVALEVTHISRGGRGGSPRRSRPTRKAAIARLLAVDVLDGVVAPEVAPVGPRPGADLVAVGIDGISKAER